MIDLAWSVCAIPQEIAFPKMVASCCRFLCYFCRISRQNQKAMFDHLSYLLENSSVGLGEYISLFRYCSYYHSSGYLMSQRQEISQMTTDAAL